MQIPLSMGMPCLFRDVGWTGSSIITTTLRTPQPLLVGSLSCHNSTAYNTARRNSSYEGSFPSRRISNTPPNEPDINAESAIFLAFFVPFPIQSRFFIFYFFLPFFFLILLDTRSLYFVTHFFPFIPDFAYFCSLALSVSRTRLARQPCLSPARHFKEACVIPTLTVVHWKPIVNIQYLVFTLYGWAIEIFRSSDTFLSSL